MTGWQCLIKVDDNSSNYASILYDMHWEFDYAHLGVYIQAQKGSVGNAVGLAHLVSCEATRTGVNEGGKILTKGFQQSILC